MASITHGFLLAGLAVSLLATRSATAVTQLKTYEFSAADACQLSVPTTDTKVRPRANGYRNEGTTSQFVICGMGGYELSSVFVTSLMATSADGKPHSMTCTGFTGMPGSSGVYSTKTLVVPEFNYQIYAWTAVDFGGDPWETIQGGMNLSVTCTLPPNVALQGFESAGYTDVGN